ncbi:50S ribosomal protein L25 [Candidatus Beckwithbacteria bacterium]|nr:50S ribosomal protein L25 [Candidatus Beckwithbacteria bacterium]
MANKIILKAYKRELVGKKVKKLRKEGKIPANIYGKNIASQAIMVDLLDFKTVYKSAGETSIISLQLENEEKDRPVLIADLQAHPIDKKVLHIDFRQVDLKEKITANIPLEFVGKAPAETLGASIVPIRQEVEVEALPTDLPEKFEVDLSKLTEIGHTLTVKDLVVDTAKVKILTEEGEVLVKAEEQKEEVVEEAPAEATTEEGAEKVGEEVKKEGTKEEAKQETK